MNTVSSRIPRKILIADDEPSILSALETYLVMQNYKIYTASNAEDALDTFKKHRPLLVITDLKMPGKGGDHLLTELKKIDEYVQIIIITGFATIKSAVDSLKAGAFDYITKPFRLEVVHHAIEKAVEHLSLMIANKQLQENSLHVLESMVTTLEQRDFYTAGHSRRVTEWADAMAGELKLDTLLQRTIHLGGLIHDVGKIGIDDSILRKPSKLNKEEFEIIKTHPERGVQIIEPLEFLKETIPIIMHHHEMLDGSGYPGGLKGEDIPLGARILMVADTFDAMTSSRAYREALPAEAAMAELKRCSGSQFDPDLVKTFLKVLSYIGS